MKKPITEDEALFKLTAMCSRAEYCEHDISEKLQRWEIVGEAQARIMQHLVEEMYVDEERYSRAFVRSKIKYSKWGRRKIEQALRMKHVSESIYAPILEEETSESGTDVLRPLLEAKKKTIKAASDYERNGKLIRFALGRGFDMDLIQKVIKEI
ncbi:MAG: regulatory protein RecX [Prevotellaceae bacterium]|nr:regulatory protein RecX [Prevotellaceae bacterium]